MNRREFLAWSGRLALGAALAPLLAGGRGQESAPGLEPAGPARPGRLSLFLAGDVMPGRGIDQVLPYSVDPRLFEPFVRDARRYVEIAEEASGPIPDEVSYRYVWGDGLEELARLEPHARIVNLETAVTNDGEPWPGKAIHYRLHPENVDLLTVADIDVTALGNNHVLDWGYPGLEETLLALDEAGLQAPGAGGDLEAAAAPAVIDTAAGRLLVFSFGAASAGVPPAWAAGETRAGVNFLPDLDPARAEEVAQLVAGYRAEGDRVVLSIHWGGNWGYEIPAEQRAFAHALITAGAADVVHGHSSHHPKALEVFEGRPILYGAGDLINDYEGIGGHAEYRPELTLMYFPTLDEAGALISFEMTPMRIRRFRLERASEEAARWLADRLDRESRAFGSEVVLTDEGRLALRWEG